MRADWIPELQCYVERIVYDFTTKIGQIWMPSGSCTDMQGAVDYFTKIDPRVASILTWAGGEKDTHYVSRDGGWRAHSR